MTALTLRCRCRWREAAGRVHGELEVPVAVGPERWTEEDARQTVWAIQRAVQASSLTAIRLIEVVATRLWRIEIAANTGTASTPLLRLSGDALIWYQRVAFELPAIDPHSTPDG